MAYQVKDYMSDTCAYVTVNDTLKDALDKMSSYGTKKITVTDEKQFIYAIISKSDLYKHIGSKANLQKFRTSKIKDVIDEHKYSIVAYPQNDIYEALSIMNSMEINFLPIGKSPWEKKLVGFLKIEDIHAARRRRALSC